MLLSLCDPWNGHVGQLCGIRGHWKSWGWPSGAGPCSCYDGAPTGLATPVCSSPWLPAQEAAVAAPLHGPHTQTPGRSLKPRCNQEQAKPLDGCAACGSQRMVLLNGRRNSAQPWTDLAGGGGVSSECSEGDRPETCHFSKLCSFLIKGFFTFLTKTLPPDFTCGWWWVVKPHFLVGNCHWKRDTSQDIGPSWKVNPLHVPCPSK